MEPQDNKSLALQKAINSHEQAEAAIADLQGSGDDPAFAPMLQRIQANIAELRAYSQATSPEEKV
ncbi:MAG TPA: hypothetical protein VEX86_13410 [Longimicrobium sp.]|nr:hypothetical protein [Longimicrobium sp.]